MTFALRAWDLRTFQRDSGKSLALEKVLVKCPDGKEGMRRKSEGVGQLGLHIYTPRCCIVSGNGV